MVTIKTLFALSCNRCSYPGCDLALADDQWRGVRADIAHIRGERPGAPRYAPEMTDEDRDAVDNLMLMCPNHHREIDRLRPQDWPAERLIAVKLDHEKVCNENRRWRDSVTDSQLEDFANLLILQTASDEPDAAAGPPPRLVIQKGERQAYDVVNIGDVDAFNVAFERGDPGDEDVMLRVEDGPVRRLSPGARARACIHARTFGSSGRAVVIVRWEDSGGNHYDGEFPLD